MTSTVLTCEGPSRGAVIIPFYQRKSGLLRMAVDSVMRQRSGPPAQVIIVDDGSPLPASEELEGYIPAIDIELKVVRQANQGVAAARNTGLGLVNEAAEWIAFLDPDDVWEENHLSAAISAINHGYDFFFADNRQDHDPLTLFELSGLNTSDHLLIDPYKKLYEFVGDLFSTILTYSPIKTSTVVYRRRGYQNIRFREKYRTYEDAFFWLHFRHARIGFCENVQVYLGQGVNISKRPDDWRTNRSLEISRDVDGMYRLILSELSLNREQQALVRRLSRRNRDAVARTVVAMLRNRFSIDYSVVREVMGGDLALAATCARVVITEIVRRVLSRF